MIDMESASIAQRTVPPQSLSTVGKGYAVAAAAARGGGTPNNNSNNSSVHNNSTNRSGHHKHERPSAVAAQQGRRVLVNRWDGAELVEAVFEEAAEARRKQQADKAANRKVRTTLVDRENKKLREKRSAYLASSPSAEKSTADDSPASPVGSATTAHASPTKDAPAAGLKVPGSAPAPVLSANTSAPIVRPLAAIATATQQQQPLSAGAEAGGMPDGGGRIAPVLSSPRVNPLLTEKRLVEAQASRMDGFLSVTAASLPGMGLLIHNNLSQAARRQNKRKAIMDRQRRRLLRGNDDSSASSDGEDGTGTVSPLLHSRSPTGGGAHGHKKGLMDSDGSDGSEAFISPEEAMYAALLEKTRAAEGLTTPDAGNTHMRSLMDKSRSIRAAADATAATTTTAHVDTDSVVLSARATTLRSMQERTVLRAIRGAARRDHALGLAHTIDTVIDKHGNTVRAPTPTAHGTLHPTTTNTTTNISTGNTAAPVTNAPTSLSQTARTVNTSTKIDHSHHANVPLEVSRELAYQPGNAVTSLVASKGNLSRAEFIAAQRNSSCFLAPKRQPLMHQSCAPSHANYVTKYAAVERRSARPSFAAVDHHRFQQLRALKAKNLLHRRRHGDLSDGSDGGDASRTVSGARGGLQDVSAIPRSTSEAPSRAERSTTHATNTTAASGGGGGFFMTQQKAQTSPERHRPRSATSYDNSSGDEQRSPQRRKRNSEMIPNGDHPDARRAARERMQHTTEPDATVLAGPEDAGDYRFHSIRDASSAFKAPPRAEVLPPTVDAMYYPLPDVGGTTYGPGKFHENAREREWCPFGHPCGAPTTYNLDLVDEQQRARARAMRTPAFQKVIGRSQQKHPFVLANQPGVDTSQLAYKDQVPAVSKRTPSPVDMAHQTSRPPPKQAAKTEAPHIGLNSITTIPKKGFVDIGRMTNFETRDPSYFARMRLADTTRALQVDDSHVSRVAPAYSFGHSGSRDPAPGRSVSAMDMRAEHPQHDRLRPRSVEPTDHHSTSGMGVGGTSPVRRRAPVAHFPLTDRETRPILRQPCPGAYAKGSTAQLFEAQNAVYEVKDTTHVPAANFGPLVSRDQREKTLTQRFASTDAVYDVPRSDKSKLVLPMDKMTGRAHGGPNLSILGA